MIKRYVAIACVGLIACGVGKSNVEETNKTKLDSAKKSIELVNGEFKDTRDDINYLTIKYPNGQIWMVENMVYFKDSTVKRFNKYSGTYQDEDYMIAKPYDKESPNVGMNEYDPYNYRDAGLYYDFYSAQIACPKGWHLATKSDWVKFMSQIQKQDDNMDNVNTLGMLTEDYQFGLTANPRSEFDISGQKTQLYWVGVNEEDLKKLNPGMSRAIKIVIFENDKRIRIEETVVQINQSYYPCKCIKD